MSEKSKYSVFSYLCFLPIIFFILGMLLHILNLISTTYVLRIILFSLPILGLILAIFALYEIKKKSLRGRTFAIIGIIVAIVCLVIYYFASLIMGFWEPLPSIKVFDIGENYTQATSDNPLVVPDYEVISKPGKYLNMKVYYFNKDGAVAKNVSLEIEKCIDPKQVQPDFTPKIASSHNDVNPAEMVGFSIQIKIPENLSPGDYVCTLQIGYDNNLASKDFTFKII